MATEQLEEKVKDRALELQLEDNSLSHKEACEKAYSEIVGVSISAEPTEKNKTIKTTDDQQDQTKYKIISLQAEAEAISDFYKCFIQLHYFLKNNKEFFGFASIAMQNALELHQTNMNNLLNEL